VNLSYPLAFGAPLRGFTSEYCIPFCVEKLEWLGYPMVKKSKISLFVLTQLTNVTDRHTDRQTDRQTPHDGIGRAYASHRAAKNILNVLGKRKNDMLAVHLTKTYCLPILLYSCEIWAVSPVDMRSVDVSWNNAFRKLFNWRDSVKPLQFYCFCLPASVFVRQRRVLFWLKMVRSDNVILHTLAGCSRDSVVALLTRTVNLPCFRAVL